MLSKVKTISLFGLEGKLIEVQTDIGNGIPEFDIVGLPDTSLKEAKKRIISAIKNSGIKFPCRKILINLAPAHFRKEGRGFDLAMAIGILYAIGIISTVSFPLLCNTVFIGELSLDGRINNTKGILAMCIEAKKLGIKKIVLPKANLSEIRILEEVDIIPIENLNQVVKYLNKEINISAFKCKEKIIKKEYDNDFSEIKGQENAKRALEISAAGNHNCLLIGSPGTGKTMLAKSLPTILPELTVNEIMEIIKIYSISGKLHEGQIIFNRPFRTPHHTTTIKTIIGGGKIPIPRRNKFST